MIIFRSLVITAPALAPSHAPVPAAAPVRAPCPSQGAEGHTSGLLYHTSSRLLKLLRLHISLHQCYKNTCGARMDETCLCRLPITLVASCYFQQLSLRSTAQYISFQIRV